MFLAFRARSLVTSAGVRRASTSTVKPFKVLGIQQIAVGGPDKSRLANLWINILGVEKVGTFRSEKENVDEDILKTRNGVEVDIMQVCPQCTRPRNEGVDICLTRFRQCLSVDDRLHCTNHLCSVSLSRW